MMDRFLADDVVCQLPDNLLGFPVLNIFLPFRTLILSNTKIKIYRICAGDSPFARMQQQEKVQKNSLLKRKQTILSIILGISFATFVFSCLNSSCFSSTVFL